MTRPVRAVFLGSGRFGSPTLARLSAHSGVDVVGVVTAPPRAAGRGRQPTPTPIDEAAAQLGVATVLRPIRLRSPDAIADVLALAPELAVLADYGQIVPRPILDLRYGALNLHPSLLPRNRGASPIQAAILAGEPETGVTLMKMDEGLDTGPIVAQARLALSGTETAPQLEERLAAMAADLLLETLDAGTRGEIEPRPQAEEDATMTRPLRRDDGRLDPDLAADVLERQVRAYQPWPGSFLDTDSGRLVVWRAVARDASPAQAAAGTLVAVDRGLGLASADGVLDLVEVQPAGGRRMSGADLLRGRPALVGTRLRAPAPASSVQER